MLFSLRSVQGSSIPDICSLNHSVSVASIKKLHPETGEVFPFYSIMIVFFSGSFSISFGKLIFSSPFS